MLSFNKSKNALPVAQIKGGKYNNKIIYLYSEETTKNNIPVDIMEILDEIIQEKRGRLRFDKMSQLQKSIKYNTRPLDDTISPYYDQTLSKIDYYSKKDLKIHDGELIPLPSTTRQCLFVAGPAGSGKSTYISKYAQEFQKMYPNKKVFVFSRLNEDEPIDILDPIRIQIDDELLEDPINPDELEDSLVIFDDTDTIPDKQLNEAIRKLKNDLLETGRHQNVYVLISSHLMTNYKETRTVLNECHSITFFPSAGSSHQITYCLKNYFGLSKDQINKIMSLPSRWVSIYKNFPQYVLYSKGIYLLSH